MDRAKTELLAKTEDYIQNNVTVGEFLARIEPHISRDASRRLYSLLKDSLDVPMPE